jgi:hypothetical protein
MLLIGGAAFDHGPGPDYAAAAAVKSTVALAARGPARHAKSIGPDIRRRPCAIQFPPRPEAFDNRLVRLGDAHNQHVRDEYVR